MLTGALYVKFYIVSLYSKVHSPLGCLQENQKRAYLRLLGRPFYTLLYVESESWVTGLTESWVSVSGLGFTLTFSNFILSIYFFLSDEKAQDKKSNRKKTANERTCSPVYSGLWVKKISITLLHFVNSRSPPFCEFSLIFFSCL